MEALGFGGISMDVVGGGGELEARPGVVVVLKRAINLEKSGERLSQSRYHEAVGGQLLSKEGTLCGLFDELLTELLL